MSANTLIIMLLLVCAGAVSAVQQLISFSLLCGVFGTLPGTISVLFGALLCAGAAGAAWISNIADRSRRPLGLFALLLMGAGVFSLMPPFLITTFDHGLMQMQRGFAPESLAQGIFSFGVAFMFSLPGAGCFCASLVAGIQYWRRREGLVQAVSVAVFSVCVGAAAGVIIGLLFVPGFQPLWAAASAGGAAVLIAIAAAGFSQSEENEPANSERQPPEDDENDRVLLHGALAGGFGLLCLMLLGRVVLYALEESAVTASAVMTVVLAGIGLGGLGASLLRSRSDPGAAPGIALLGFALLSAVAAGLCSAMYHTLMFERLLMSQHAELSKDLVWYLGVAFPLMGLPAVGLGIAVPLLCGYAFERGRPMSQATGGMLSAIGAGAGIALIMHSTIVSFTGLQSGVAVLAFATACVGVLIQENKKTFFLALLILVGYAVFQPPLFPQKSHTAESRVIDYLEGPQGTYSVLGDSSGNARSWTIDGHLAGDLAWAPAERRFAHLPLSIAKDPKDILVLGIGGGGCLDALPAYPEVRQVHLLLPFPTAAEGVKRSLVQSLSRFHERTEGKALQFRFGQLRTFLRTELRSWDFILGSLDWAPGPAARMDLASLQTLGLIENKLMEDGLFCLAVPCGIAPDALRYVIENFSESFPEGKVAFVQPDSILFMGGGDLSTSRGRLEERLADPDFLAELKDANFRNAEEILTSHICTIQALRSRFPEEGVRPDPRLLKDLFRQPEIEELAARRKASLEFFSLSLKGTDPSKAARSEQPMIKASTAMRHLIKGLIYALGGDREAAEAEFDEGLEANPEDARLLYAKAGGSKAVIESATLTKLDQTRRAELLKTAIDRSPGAWKKHLTMGEVAMSTGRYALALKEFRVAEALAPAEIPAMFSVALALSENGRHQEAVEKYRDVLAMSPEHVESKINLSFCLDILKEYDEAEKLLKEVISADAQNHLAQYNLASLLKRRSRIDESLEHYGLALEAKPNYAAAIYDFAILLDKNDELYPAVLNFKKFIHLMPRSKQAKVAKKRIEEIGRAPFRR